MAEFLVCLGKKYQLMKASLHDLFKDTTNCSDWPTTATTKWL